MRVYLINTRTDLHNGVYHVKIMKEKLFE